MEKKRGRPPKDPSELATDRLELRLMPTERSVWQKAADKAGKLLAAWIRDRLNRAAKRETSRE